MTKILIDEALRLADAIELAWLENVDADKADIDMIQAELRQLYAENQALRQALEKLAKLGNGDRYGNSIGNSIAREALDKMAENARELGLSYEQPRGEATLAQQEPYGWHTEDHLTDRSATTYSKDVADRWQSKGWPVTPFYTTPPAPAHEPDPDELTIAYMSGVYEGKKRKPWVGLTDEERAEVADVSDCFEDIVDATEAKLKEKNQ